MTDIRDKFYEKLKQRNEHQREAVEAITGPVMVVAGPGTGKTDVLGLRIGNILEKTDTDIHNILCLTYTEAGAVEMRKRLLDYVGPIAYNAQMFTFHGFCNMVIHENIELFGLYRDFQPVSALEQFQILKEVIDLQPMDHPLKRYSGQIYFETRRLKSLFDTMKLEQWPVEHMHKAIDSWEEEMKESPEFIYKRRGTAKGKAYQKGDLKEATFRKKVVAPMILLRAAVDTFETYNKLLRERGRYDYHDMLTWVHDQFEENDFLLGQYQERFQYFLVDEFQDSNGIQMAILNLLVNQWGPDSDIFIVGDDDQSIFRFQGAMMQNIIEFKELYDPQVVILTENYRSTQNILDAASSVIQCNEERLVAQYPVYTKNLVARADHAASEVMPEVHIYPNWTQEVAALLKELTELHGSGVLQKESVAVIYRKHRQVEEIVHALEVREIPINVKRPVNILERPVIRNIMTILKYINLELREAGSGEPLLYELMHYRYFDISVRDAGVMAVECRRMSSRDKKAYWRDVMADEKLLRNIGIHNPEPIVALDTLLNTWIQEFEHFTLQELIEQVFTKGGVLNWIFKSPNRSWHLQLIKTYFDYVKNESERNPNINLNRFLEDIDLMQEHGIELPVNKILTAKDGIYFVTAHSAKGMQFDRVFMLGCT
ncbi:MAG: ATP-dependent helicase, partial [Bacteroidetes bacterium]